jgi:hypothetical protein
MCNFLYDTKLCDNITKLNSNDKMYRKGGDVRIGLVIPDTSFSVIQVLQTCKKQVN